MKAAVIYEHGGPGSIRYGQDFRDPVAAGGEVVVRVKAAALNYHDIFTRRGMPGIKVPMPCIMGIDFAGDIAALGAGISGWAVGDRVMIDPVDRVGGGGLIGEVRHGGLAEYCAVPAHNLVRLPANVSYETAAGLPGAYGTALRMMVTIGQVKAGEKVLILGASGGVGTCCVQLAKLAGAEIIVCASSSGKLARLKELGAEYGIDYSREDFVKWIYAKYGKPHRRSFNGGVDVVVNFTGGGTLVPAPHALAKPGRTLACGAAPGFGPLGDRCQLCALRLCSRRSLSALL